MSSTVLNYTNMKSQRSEKPHRALQEPTLQLNVLSMCRKILHAASAKEINGDSSSQWRRNAPYGSPANIPFVICHISAQQDYCNLQCWQFTIQMNALIFQRMDCGHISQDDTKMSGQVHFKCMFYLILLTNHYHYLYCLRMQYLLDKMWFGILSCTQT